MVALAALVEGAEAYSQLASRAMKAGYTMQEIGKAWSNRKKKSHPTEHGKHGRGKTVHKHTHRVAHHTHKAKNSTGENMTKRKSHGSHRGHRKHYRASGGGSMNTGSLLKTAGVTFVGGLAALALTDVVTAQQTGVKPTKSTFAVVVDRTRGALEKLTKMQYAVPILAGGVMATQKIPMLNRNTSRVLGMGMIGAPLIAASLTTGSPGTPTLDMLKNYQMYGGLGGMTQRTSAMQMTV
jgi:hypothetical protein